ncbi:circadian clock KaiB family protein [Dyadobacter sandarakinus]|uniref:Circadian clock protein KaiB n=1 Tax=Dyadobacter sandarakinus TaxID=2747268 RepID=A0ABX7I2Y4_9BACT|nr:circadian clock KaiB family protein [Dyadobacter sandarakinus]QRR00248.1 circadian clock protein KaiB [Dyadobacter sandarakinus]
MNQDQPAPESGQDHDDSGMYVLRLYVAGASPNSTRAIVNIREICERHLSGNYKLQIIDVYQDKTLASREQLLALPLLVRERPYPEKKLVGDMSDTAKVLNGLGISPA